MIKVVHCKRCLVFILLLFVFSSSLCFAISDVPIPEVSQDVAPEPPPSIDTEPIPELGVSLPTVEPEPEPESVDYSSSLLEISQKLSDISAFLEICVYFLVPFGFAFFICWQLGRLFFITFFR